VHLFRRGRGAGNRGGTAPLFGEDRGKLSEEKTKEQTVLLCWVGGTPESSLSRGVLRGPRGGGKKSKKTRTYIDVSVTGGGLGGGQLKRSSTGALTDKSCPGWRGR